MPLPPSYLTAQDRITDSGGHSGVVRVGGKDKKDEKNKHIYGAAATPHQERSNLDDILNPKTKNRLSYYGNDGRTPPHFYCDCPLFPLRSPSFSFWFSFLLGAIVMTPQQTQWLGS